MLRKLGLDDYRNQSSNSSTGKVRRTPKNLAGSQKIPSVITLDLHNLTKPPPPLNLAWNACQHKCPFCCTAS